MKVGFIGLGTMGGSMALNVRKAGYELSVNDLRRDTARPHLEAGAKWADSPRAIAAAADVIFTSLPGPREAEAVGEELLNAMLPGSAWFDLSTNSPTVVRRIHARFAAKGLPMLDAPVSGGPHGAKARKLALLVGGDKAVFDRFRPVLDAIGDQILYIGAIGAGSVAKLVHNCAGYMIQTALAEVFTLGVKAGVDPLDLWAAVRQCSLGRMRTFDRLGKQFLQGSFEPADFALQLAHKDVTLATELGRELGVPMRIANMTYAEMSEALNRGWGHRDSRAAMLLQEERAGVEIKVPAEAIQEVLKRDA
ncbi:MAG: 3-hydroxyisobutyrate dehydrogenase [Betaproteobacteria bacterium]|jgi:3-hydroxyisobutyrate dehydrogenase|nr:3-hydroxyisobutyrate dehydrogenase [Betaproteobacteria bacterium]